MVSMIKTRRTQSERRAQAEVKLLNAAIDLIASKGVLGFTLAEVGLLAGYSRGLPSHHFETKDKLIEAVVNRLINKSISAITLQNETVEGAGIDLIRAHFIEHSRNLNSASNTSRALYALYLSSLFNPKISTLMKSYNEIILDTTLSRFQEAVELKQIRPDIDLRAEALAFVAYKRGAALLSLTDPDYDIVENLNTFFENMRKRIAYT